MTSSKAERQLSDVAVLGDEGEEAGGDDAGINAWYRGTSVNQRNQRVFRNTETPISDASSFRDNIRGRPAPINEPGGHRGPRSL